MRPDINTDLSFLVNLDLQRYKCAEWEWREMQFRKEEIAFVP